MIVIAAIDSATTAITSSCATRSNCARAAYLARDGGPIAAIPNNLPRVWRGCGTAIATMICPRRGCPRLLVRVGQPDVQPGEMVCAVVQRSREHRDVTLDELCEFLDYRGLMKQKRPERVVFVDEFSLTGLGNVAKSELAHRLQEELYDGLGPR